MATNTNAVAGGADRAIKPKMNVVIVGHVDHGKSTLIGRLLYDTDSLPDGKYEAVERVCEDRGKPFEFAFLLDALEEERDQGITIDTAQVQFSTSARDYVIIDAPGHKEFIKNMVTGAASAHAALLIIDADEGVREQSRRHGYLLALLGIREVIVLVNKMDLVDYSQQVYESVKSEYEDFLAKLDVKPRLVLPVSALDGTNVASSSQLIKWYDGPTVLEALDLFPATSAKSDQPLRMPVQDVYKFDKRRIIAGRVESGTLKVGDSVIFSPSRQEGVVGSIPRWSAPERDHAMCGESIGITLRDELFVERGEILSHPQDTPQTSNSLSANLFWLGARHLRTGKKYVLKLATQELECWVSSISSVIDTSSLAPLGNATTEVAKNEVATVSLELKAPAAFDCFNDVPETGRFVLLDGFDVAGGGIIPKLDPAGSYQI